MLMSLGVKADYSYISLSKVILESENSVVGEIVDLDEDYFYLRVDSIIYGSVKMVEEKTIYVKK